MSSPTDWGMTFRAMAARGFSPVETAKMTIAQIVCSLGIEPAGEHKPDDSFERKRQAQFDIFRGVCLRYEMLPRALGSLPIEDVARMVENCYPHIKTDSATLKAALAEFLASL